VLAGDHPAVDEDGFEAGVAAVDHRVHDLQRQKWGLRVQLNKSIQFSIL
jgi:hypothetical protein